MIVVPTDLVFPNIYDSLVSHVLAGEKIRQPPHQMMTMMADDRWVTREAANVSFQYKIPVLVGALARDVQPNLPWAEDHFNERVSGKPLNPPPSHERWPYARAGNEEHMEGGKFSHTYPERFWPKYAAMGGPNFEEYKEKGYIEPRYGIRFAYGDYMDLVHLLWDSPQTRQAYLPIWFPEDLTAAREGQRVPCTLGYHFLMRGNELNMTYFIRSCDLVRYFRDDVYMACRLVQYTLGLLRVKRTDKHWAPWSIIQPGKLTMHIGSLHCFEGDVPMLEKSRG